MTKIVATLMGLGLALTLPTAPAIPTPSCPEVESARDMLMRTAASQNDRELQAPRRQPETNAPRDQGQDVQAPRAGEQETPGASASQGTVPPVRSEVTQAAALVKEADAACQAGKTADAAQKAKAALVLMQQQ
jgi:hypothetical protein